MVVYAAASCDAPVPRNRLGSGSVVFAALLLDLLPLPVGSSRSFLPVCRANRGRLTDRPVAFASSTECALTHAGTSSLPCDSASIPPLVGFFASLSTYPIRVHSHYRSEELQLRWSATKPTTRSDPALSQRFAGFLRGRARGSIAPHCRTEVRYVSWNPDQCLACPKAALALDLTNPVPRSAVHTPRRTPLTGSRTVSPRPLPS